MYMQCAHAWCPQRLERVPDPWELELWMVLSCQCGCWEPNLGSLQERPVLLTASAQEPRSRLSYSRSCCVLDSNSGYIPECILMRYSPCCGAPRDFFFRGSVSSVLLCHCCQMDVTCHTHAPGRKYVLSFVRSSGIDFYLWHRRGLRE